MFKLLLCCALLFPFAVSGQIFDPYLGLGVEYRDDYIGNAYDTAHQFFISKKWTQGIVFYNQRAIPRIIRYDILTDKLVTQYIRDDSIYQIEPPRLLVTKFVIYGRTFIDYDFHFYEKREDTLIFHAKSILREQPVDGNFYSLIDNKKDKWFLLQNGVLKKIKAPRK